MVTPTITRGTTTAAPHGSTSDTQGEEPHPSRHDPTEGTAARPVARIEISGVRSFFPLCGMFQEVCCERA